MLGVRGLSEVGVWLGGAGIPGRLLLGGCRGWIGTPVVAVRVRRMLRNRELSSSRRLVQRRMLALRKLCQAAFVFRHPADPSFPEKQASSLEKRFAPKHLPGMSSPVQEL